MSSFQATQVPLHGVNIIEASAGTGKTYSIAILTLRLLLEKGVPLPEILMVTFTKAAVAELEDRIRLFVRQAQLVTQGSPIEDKTIETMVLAYQSKLGKEKVHQLVHAAMLQLDETAVMTIHSFCQQSLTQYAFETGQHFQAEPLQDTSELIEQSIQDYWRKKIAILPVPILHHLSKYFHISGARTAVQHAQNGKVFETSNPAYLASQTIESLCDEIEMDAPKTEEAYAQLKRSFQNKQQEVLSLIEQHENARKSILKHYPNLDDFFKAAEEKSDTQYFKKVFEPILPSMQAWLDAKKNVGRNMIFLAEKLYQDLLAHCMQFMQRYKQKNGLITFDDMIQQLHQALQGKHKASLAAAMANAYRAVFIDEFQDTDKLQYEIFRSCFHQGQIVFYIGDPKQSIYAFRKADIHTYFQAITDIRAKHEMNVNFRSSTSMIEALNHFFSVEDPFYFQDETARIDYIPVQSPIPNLKNTLSYKGQSAPALFLRSAVDIAGDVAETIHSLLEGKDWHLEKAGKKNRIIPAQIGILVRKTKEGRAIRTALNNRNIPAVLIADEKILESAEAQKLLYTLQAISSNSINDVRRAILVGFNPVSFADMNRLDNEQAVGYYAEVRHMVEEKGIYQGLQYWMDLFQIRQEAWLRLTKAAEKSITNLEQLIELLHKQETRNKRDLTALIHWLQRGIDKEPMDGDEYLQRMESDEQAVTIMTIHKSKGLEFPIVFLPHANFNHNKNDLFVLYRNPQNGAYAFQLKGDKNNVQIKEWNETQTTQEDRRLLYVAATRSVSGCFIYKPASKTDQSKTKSKAPHIGKAIAPYFKKIENEAHPNCLILTDKPNVESVWKNPHQDLSLPSPLIAHAFQLAQSNWRKVSYTALAAKHDPIRRAISQASLTDYDRFVFQQLSRGAQTGNLIHYLFENIDFDRADYWPQVIKRAIQRFDPAKQELYAQGILQLLQETMHVDLPMQAHPFQLSTIVSSQKRSELEFDFMIPEFNPSQLAALSTESTQIAVQPYSHIQGLMNGKIDLLFEHEKRYYILDWKSNYLGDQLADYQQAQIKAAMNENNYHLQYLLYTVAVKKYLSDRLPDFDYERDFGGVIYLFIRGVRRGTDYGLFTTKPSLQTIQQLEKIF
jgi:exodeoxyribonuclease V beta subunit